MKIIYPTEVGTAPDLQRLRELAIWLEGIKTGQGGRLEPLGTAVLTDLRAAIRELERLRREGDG